MSTRRILIVSYSQIAVFQASLSNPFNDWTDAHIDQGFSWRPGSVSFKTEVDGGPHEVIIACTSYMDAPVEALRAIEVPFIVSGSDPVAIASIGDEFSVDIPEGSYALRFAIAADCVQRVELSFLKADTPDFRIVRKDVDLTLDSPLMTKAEPA